MTRDRLFDALTNGLTQIVAYGMHPTKISCSQEYRELLLGDSDDGLYVWSCGSEVFAIPVEVANLASNVMFYVTTKEQEVD